MMRMHKKRSKWPISLLLTVPLKLFMSSVLILLISISDNNFCLHDFGMRTRAYAEEPCFVESISKEEYLADYDEMWNILEECYPFFGVIERMGINADAVKMEGRAKLKARIEEDGGFASFFESVNDVCASLGYFAHLQPVDQSYYQYLSNLIISEKDMVLFDDWFSVLRNPRSAELYNSMVKVKQNADGGDSSASLISPFVRLYPKEGVGYIGLSTFEGRIVDRDKQKIESFLRDTADYEHIIIDITGNRGGSSYYWHNIVSGLGGQYAYEHYVFYTRKALEKMPVFRPQDVILPIEVMPSDVSFLHPEDKEGLDYYTSVQMGFDFGAPQIPHKAKRWLLVDQYVFSAAEEFAVFCKETRWAVLVGHSTGGDGIGEGNPSIIALPNTGLILRFSNDYALNSNGSCNAEDGTSPDILCERGETPILTCLRQLDMEGVNTQRLRKDRLLVSP